MTNNKQNKDLQNLVLDDIEKNLTLVDNDFIESLKEENDDLNFKNILL